MMKKVLFVCTGNTCRSPMCEAYFNTLDSKFRAHSAGIHAENGTPAASNAIKAVTVSGGNLCDFRSRCLTVQMIEESELIVGMTSSHLQAILALSPKAAVKTTMLCDNNDISDPFGGDYPVYRKCFNELKSAIDKFLNKINKNQENE